MNLREIYNSVKGKVEAVESLLEKELSGDLEIVTEMSSHSISAGGKRIRPALVCLAARALGYEGEKDIRYGAVFEMVHTATLIHDDIIDNADTRRGRTVLNRRYGSTMSILFGDHLYNKAMELAIRDDDFRIVRLINQATEKMITGEILQFNRNFDSSQTLDQYLDLIERKTAWVFAACAKSAAILANGGRGVEESFFNYGMQLGLAFQVIDDYFDYAASEKQLGKPVGSDLMEGKITYPLFLLMEREPEVVEDVARAFDSASVTNSFIKELLKKMKKTGALADSRRIAQEYAERAVSHLEGLPLNETVRALRSLPEFVVNRKK